MNSELAAENSEQAVDPERLVTLGEMVRLATRSESHRDIALSEFERRILRPAALDQFRIYRTENGPVALVTWALVTNDAHQSLLSERRTPDDGEWRSGDNLWITDAIIPRDAYDVVLADLTQAVFPNKIAHRWIMDDDGAWTVARYFGANRQGDAAASRR